TSGAGSTCGPGAARVSSSATATSAALRAAAGYAGLLVHEYERPLVVVRSAQIDFDRLVLALAADANQTAGDGTARRRERRAGLIRTRVGRVAGRGHGGRRGHGAARRCNGLPTAARSRLTLSGRQARLSLARADRLEVVLRDRILVFLAQEVAGDEHVVA